jgi:hypothetical protein
MPNVFNGDYRGFVRWLTLRAAGDHDLPDVFLAPFSTSNEAPEPHAPNVGRYGANCPKTHPTPMTHLAWQIYNKRPDLQAFFPDPCGEDDTKYLVWLLSYGKRQYGISEVYLETLRRQWRVQIERLPSSWCRLRYRLLLNASIACAALSTLATRMPRVPLWLRTCLRSDAPSGDTVSTTPTPARTNSVEIGLISSPAANPADQIEGN